MYYNNGMFFKKYAEHWKRMLWLLTYSQYNEYIIAKLRFVLFRIILRNQVFVLKLRGLISSSLIQRRPLIPDCKNSYPKVLNKPVRYGQLLSKEYCLSLEDVLCKPESLNFSITSYY